MNRSALFASIIAFTCFSVLAQRSREPAGPRTNVREEIKKIEEERNEAILHGDFATLDRLTAEGYTFVTLRGELRTKAEILKGFKSGSFKYESREIRDLVIRIYGNTAVVIGRSIQKGMENEKDYSGDYRFTRVYVKQHGQWLTVALQTTVIQKE